MLIIAYKDFKIKSRIVGDALESADNAPFL